MKSFCFRKLRGLIALTSKLSLSSRNLCQYRYLDLDQRRVDQIFKVENKNPIKTLKISLFTMNNPDAPITTAEENDITEAETEKISAIEDDDDDTDYEEDKPEVINEDEDEIQVINEENLFRNATVSEVLIELDDNLKSKLAADLMAICEVDENTARFTLEAHKWNMQASIDMLLDGNQTDSDVEEVPVSPPSASARTPVVPSSSSSKGIPVLDVFSPETESKKEKETEIERSAANSGEAYSTWAPEQFSILSWNLDGLDDKNLEKRTDYVLSLVEKEKHAVLFFQELLPYTFDYIARKLISQYKPVIGTEDPSCDYLTATFLRINTVHYEDHYILPFPNTVMGRTLLVTKAFIGRAKLALLNSHLESTGEFSAARQVQLKTCFDICSSFDPEYNVIFGGDLNLRDKEVSGSLPSSMCDLWVQCGSRKTCQYTWDLTRNTNKQMPSKFQPKCRFDRYYFRNSTPPTLTPEFFGVTGIEKVAGTQSFPSDHWAIIAFFAVSKEARKPAPKKRKIEN